MSIELQANLTQLLRDPENLKAFAPYLAAALARNVLAQPGVLVIGDLDGMGIFKPEGGGTYDGHYLFPSWTRGASALKRARLILNGVFRHPQVKCVRGEVSVNHPAARRLTAALGFRRLGPCHNADVGPAIRYEITREEWLQKGNAPPT